MLDKICYILLQCKKIMLQNILILINNIVDLIGKMLNFVIRSRIFFLGLCLNILTLVVI